ncbi:fumarate hydratase subunit alpha [Thermodesulfitimonas autotrophica]|uniref:Fumarate hydratase subunit alpha n=1 Tax=Thermodesulfitimonas autotrophica TaxID=1894989 RepID=A0A3N5BA80_9THEO|nr:fumarate hydratase [Thermodesulfitimonas autotrophica]RPF42575.1 fumarate hydratase subunit alpha [Thermodesulfitimonas autotrophica]
MRTIAAGEITAVVARLCREANVTLGEDVLQVLEAAREREESPRGRDVLDKLLANARLAQEEGMPLCQDTGVAVVFLEVGQDLHIAGDLEAAVHEGVRQGYSEGYLRKSVVRHPLDRVNTGDNTPAVIHYRIVPGDRLKITVAPKGAGSENMSALRMLKPADGVEGVKRFVLDVVEKAGPNACPPLVVGVGIGGTMEKAALLAKEALLRPLGSHSDDPLVAALEAELLEAINRSGIGPLGLGGRVTALAVHVEVYPCHIASLPVAVNLNCHAARHRSAVLPEGIWRLIGSAADREGKNDVSEEKHKYLGEKT